MPLISWHFSAIPRGAGRGAWAERRRVDKFVAAPPRREGGPEVCESPRLRDKVKHFEKVGLIAPSPLSEAKSPPVSPRPGKAYAGKKW